MTDETKLLRETERAAHAQALFKDELLTEAFDRLEREYITHWQATTVDQIGLREKYWMASRIVGVVRSHLKTIMASGKLAQAELNQLVQEAERKKRFGII